MTRQLKGFGMTRQLRHFAHLMDKPGVSFIGSGFMTNNGSVHLDCGSTIFAASGSILPNECLLALIGYSGATFSY